MGFITVWTLIHDMFALLHVYTQGGARCVRGFPARHGPDAADTFGLVPHTDSRQVRRVHVSLCLTVCLCVRVGCSAVSDLIVRWGLRRFCVIYMLR